MKPRIRIVPDAFGWLLIRYGSTTLQAFKTERECRSWLADTARIRRAMGVA